MSLRKGMFVLGLLGVFVAGSSAKADPYYQYGGFGGGYYNYQFGGLDSFAPPVGNYYGGPGYYGAQPGFSRGGWNATAQYHYSMPRVTNGAGFQNFGYRNSYGGFNGYARPSYYGGHGFRRW